MDKIVRFTDRVGNQLLAEMDGVDNLDVVFVGETIIVDWTSFSNLVN